MAGRKPGTPKTGGRKPHTPNKVNADFRQTVTMLLENNASNVELWLQQVANGTPELTDADGKVAIKGVPGDPGKALDLMAKLAEYAAPKLARTEVTHSGGLTVTSKEQRDAAVAAATRANA